MIRNKKRFSGVLPASSSSAYAPSAIPQGCAVVEAQTITTPSPLTTALEYKGFNRGLAQVLHVDYSPVINELRQALGITSRSGLSAYRNGQVRLRADQAARVQEVFNARGIYEIWDA